MAKLGILGSCASVVFSLTCVAVAQAQSLSADFAAAAASATPAFSANQIVDKPPAVAPKRSYWGVLGGATPRWWVPDTWNSMFDVTSMEGRELRIGITRGRPLGYEFGFTFVRKSLTRFVIEDEGSILFSSAPNESEPRGALITYSPIETVHVPGIEYHSFIPIGKIGSRVQLGALLGFGVGHVPSTPVRKRVEGPPYVATANDYVPLETLPANGGFVLDGRFGALPVLPGQTGAETTEIVRDVLITQDVLFLIRGQFAADVLLAAPFKLRFSGGFNYPGAQLFGIEAVYLFGAGR